MYLLVRIPQREKLISADGLTAWMTKPYALLRCKIRGTANIQGSLPFSTVTFV